jgi:MFS family permease
MPRERNENWKAIIALCAMSFLGLASSATSPALATIGQNFPTATAEQIAAIATLSTLTGVPLTIISGLVAGRKVKFRTLAITGLGITLVGGFLPYFATNIQQILFGRAILGVGHGLMTPVSTTVILSVFKGDEIAKQYSRNSISTNVGAIIFQLLGGILCNISWRVPFMVYLAVIPVLLLVIMFLPEPGHSVKAEPGLQKVKGFDIKKIVTKHVIFWSIVHLLYMMWFYPYVTQTSGIILRNGYGNSTTSAIVLSLFTLAGVIGGYCFYGLQKRFKIRVLFIGFLINFLAYVLLTLSKEIVSYTIISCVFGFGYGVLGPAISYFLGIGLDKDYRAASIAFSTILSSLGSFGSSYAVKYSKIILKSDWERLPFVVGAVFFAAFAILFLFVKGPAQVSRQSDVEK